MSTVSPGVKIHDSTTAENDQQEMSQASDIHKTPLLLGTGNESGVRPKAIKNGGPNGAALKAIHQAVILARCLLIEISSRHEELQSKLLSI